MMKTTLYLKQFDLYVQLLCLLPAIFGLLTLQPYTAIYSYIAVGITQVVSCIVNALALKYYQKHTNRVTYQYVLVTIAVLAAAAGILNNAEIKQTLFYTLMLISPFIAVWYMWLSYKEMKFARSLANRDQFVKI